MNWGGSYICGASPALPPVNCPSQPQRVVFAPKVTQNPCYHAINGLIAAALASHNILFHVVLAHLIFGEKEMVRKAPQRQSQPGAASGRPSHTRSAQGEVLSTRLVSTIRRGALTCELLQCKDV